ncbi:MAG: hypothetical protein AVO35_11325 [Candidatus Aegiribacteria sp. MLS_C]|nr:MAG: hypothetical protein AVO35_11325 [Candidatus Aegiribacteria sp. MLS_C]
MTPHGFRMMPVIMLAGTLIAGGVPDILDLYEQVTDRLDDEYGIYRTVLSVNTEDAIYPAVGHYQETVTFHWASEGGYSWPLLAVWTDEQANASIYGEILFEHSFPEIESGQDQAVYQYVFHHDWNGDGTSYTWYWSDGLPLQSTGLTVTAEGDTLEFTPESPGSYWFCRTSKYMLELFRLIHGRSGPLR